MLLTPNDWIAFAIAFLQLAQRTTAGTRGCRGTHCFRSLLPLDPLLVELREWSRALDELRHDRTRMRHRVRELLWRYYPQMLELTDDVAAPWFLALWRLVSTPAKVLRATIASPLKRYRIRRLNAPQVLEKLRAIPIPLAAGSVAVATAHLETVAARLDLVNRQVASAELQLDRLTAALSWPGRTLWRPGCEGAGRGDPANLAGRRKNRSRYAAHDISYIHVRFLA